MRYLGGCTECHTIWRGCRCPLRCEECGAGYRDDGNSNCGTLGCATGARRVRGIIATWEEERPASEVAPIQCDAVTDVEPTVEAEPARSPESAPRPRGGVQNGRAKALGARPPSQPEEPAHRPVAKRRAAVEALLSDGLSDRAIARAVKVSPSTVAAVRRDRVNALH